MRYLPNELLSIIIDFFDIYDTISYSKANKTNYLSLKKSIQDKIAKIKTIQHFYKKKKTYFPFEESYLNLYFEPSKKRKNFIVRCYIAKYPCLLLYTYPEFLVEKTNSYNPPDKKTFLKKYLESLPYEKKRTRRHIRDFFSLDCITVMDIVYAGW